MIRTGIGVRPGISRRLSLCVLVPIVLAGTSICAFIALTGSKKVRVYPPQETLVKYGAYHLIGRFDEAFYFCSDWPEKDKYIDSVKRFRERVEYLEYKFGPLEIRDNEAFDEAARVVVPALSMTSKSRSSGKTSTLPKENGPEILPMILEKRETAEGSRWYIVKEQSRRLEIQSTWLNLPRKKASGSPTIILKKEHDSVVMRVVFNGKVISERTVLGNEEGQPRKVELFPSE